MEGFDFEAYDRQEAIEKQVRLALLDIELGETALKMQVDMHRLESYADDLEILLETIVAKNGTPPEPTGQDS